MTTNYSKAQLLRAYVEHGELEVLFIVDGVSESGAKGQIVIRHDYIVPLVSKLLFLYEGVLVDEK